MFVHDENGKPIAMFELQYGPEPRKAIVRPEHCGYVYPRLKELEKDIDFALENLGDLEEHWTVTWARIQKMEAESVDLFREAIYLDTADCNSWGTIKSIFTPGSRYIFMAATEMRRWWGESHKEFFK